MNIRITILAIPLLFPYLGAQIVSGTKVQSGYGALLSSGTACVDTTCGPVNAGSFSVSTSVGTHSFVVSNANSSPILNIPSIIIPSGGISLDTFSIPSGSQIFGVGAPYLLCTAGAMYYRTDAPTLARANYVCTSYNGTGIWVQSGTSVAPPATGGVSIAQVNQMIAAQQVYRGTWSSTQTYNSGNFVVLNGKNYISTVSGNTGNTPTDSSPFWSLISGVAGNGFTTASGTNGVAAAFQNCIPGTPCGVTAGLGYDHTDTYIPTGDGQTFVNNSSSANIQNQNNPLSSPGAFGQIFNYFGCNRQKDILGWNDSSTYKTYCLQLNLRDSVPGVTYGYGSSAAGNAQGWTIGHAMELDSTWLGGGLHGGINNYTTCVSPTDCNNTTSMVTYGNSPDGSAEGDDVWRYDDGEASVTYTATIASLTDQQHLFLNPLTDGNHFGARRFLVPSTPASTGYATAIALDSLDSGRITVLTDPNANFPVTGLSGVLADNVTVENSLAPPLGATGGPNGQFQICTYIPIKAGYTGSVAAVIGKIINFSSANHDNGTIIGTHCPAWSSTTQYLGGQGVFYAGQDWVPLIHFPPVGVAPVVGGGNWFINPVPTGGTSAAAMIGQSHAVNTMVEAGGTAGMGIDFVANEQNPTGTQPLIYPAEVIGSPDNHTLHLVRFLTGDSNQGYKLGAVDMTQYGMTNVTVASGVAQLYFFGNAAALERAPIITLSNWIPTTLNGQYALPTNNSTTGATFTAIKCAAGTGIGAVACVQDTLTASATGASGTAYATRGDTGFGNSNYRLRDLPLVFDPNDYSVAGKVTAFGTAAFIEPHPTTYTAGMALQEPHYYTQRIDPMKLTWNAWNRTTASDGTFQINMNGAGLANGTGINIPQAGIRFTGGPPASALIGGGGNGVAPDLITNISPTMGSLLHQRFMPVGNRPLIDMSEDGYLPDAALFPNAHTPLINVRTRNGSGTTTFSLLDWYYNTGIVSLCSGGCMGMTYSNALMGSKVSIYDRYGAKSSIVAYEQTVGSNYYQDGLGATNSSTNIVSNDMGTNHRVQFFVGANPNSDTTPTNATAYISEDGVVHAAGLASTDTSKNTAFSFVQAAGGTDMLPTLSTGTSYLYYKSGAVWGANGTTTAPVSLDVGFTGSCASTTTITVVNGKITGCS